MRPPRIFATIGIESFMREHRKKRKRKEALSMNDELTAQDIQKMQAELDDRRLRLMPELIEEVKRTRAFGDLSENYEYKEAKRAKKRNASRIRYRENRNKSRIRYLERMIASARVIEDHSSADEVGLYDRVTVRMVELGKEKVFQIVTTVRCDALKGLVSKESPVGKAILGRKVGDTVTVRVSDTNSYHAEILSIEKQADDGSAPLRSF